jgi:hypothetical protein
MEVKAAGKTRGRDRVKESIPVSGGRTGKRIRQAGYMTGRK